uniref:hypothetical protein n=1 Tax=Pseudomonas fluorescens TaxID=294 RepID=UPI0005EB6973|nr:hypothetical protein [Pseudomonas fluorescens]
MFLQRRPTQLTPDNEVILKYRVLEICVLRIPGQLNSDVLGRLTGVSYSSFTMRINQGIKILSRGDILLDHLLHQVLLELAILSVKIITLVTR